MIGSRGRLRADWLKVRRGQWVLFGVLVATIAGLSLPGSAAGSTELAPLGCISDPANVIGCGETQVGLGSGTDVAVSPDGKSVYQIGIDAIVTFERNPVTGALTGLGCISDVGDRVGCGTTQQGLDDAFDIAVSPDGKSVYVVGENDDAIVQFDRNTTTGALTGQGCISDVPEQENPPDPPPPSVCGATQEGLEKPRGVDVSPDGKSVYVVSAFDDAIVRFDRNTTTGALTGRGCIEDVDPTPYDSVPAGCGVTQQGLDEANQVEVSPDGQSVYATGEFDNAIVQFDRNTTTGALTGQGCISDVGDTGGCGTTQQGLEAAYGLAVSPDGESVYVSAVADSAIVQFDRNTTTGALTGQSCISDVGDPAGCGKTQRGLLSAQGIAVSPDSRAIFVSASRTLVRFGTFADTRIDSGPSGLTNNSTPRFGFSSGELAASFQCRFDAAAFGSCSGPGDSHAPSNPLPDGTHIFAVRAVDADGRADPTPASRTFTVDATPPSVSISSGPTGPTNDTTPTFGFSAESGASTECSIDTGAPAFGPCSGLITHTQLSSLADAGYTFRIRATDTAGNQRTEVRNFTVDTQAPQTTIDGGPSDPDNDTSPGFTFSSSEPGSSFECEIDSGGFSSCSSPKALAGLAEGSHTFKVRATDSAGNTDESPASYIWQIDTTPPETVISSGPSGKTTETNPSFGFSSELGAAFECRLDGPGAVSGSFETCASPRNLANLVDGVYTFQVRAKDQAGNTDPTPATRSFTVDTVPPETTIISGPSGPTSNPRPSFSFSSESGSNFECRLDSEPFEACSPPHETSDLADGSHTFEVRATDQAGNTDPTPSTRAFTVDTAPPETTIISGPTGEINETDPIFSFNSEVDTSFECRLDGAGGVAEPFSPCSSPKAYSDLADGSYTFQVRATDMAGNSDGTPATRSFSVETAPPDTEIVSGPTGLTNDATPIFALESTELGSFACKVDDGTWFACESPYTTFALADGLHQFQARAADEAGNIDPSPASQSFTVDTRPPKTTIVGAPSRRVKTKSKTVRVSVKFSAEEEDATFECALDGDRPRPCTSPFKTRVKSKRGTGKKHVISIEATDLAGNTGRTATARFRAVRKP